MSELLQLSVKKNMGAKSFLISLRSAWVAPQEHKLIIVQWDTTLTLNTQSYTQYITLWLLTHLHCALLFSFSTAHDKRQRHEVFQKAPHYFTSIPEIWFSLDWHVYDFLKAEYTGSIISMLLKWEAYEPDLIYALVFSYCIVSTCRVLRCINSQQHHQLLSKDKTTNGKSLGLCSKCKSQNKTNHLVWHLFLYRGLKKQPL